VKLHMWKCFLMIKVVLGVVEFRDQNNSEEAVSSMDKYDIKGRKLVVKRDFNGDLIQRQISKEKYPIKSTKTKQIVNAANVGMNNIRNSNMNPPQISSMMNNMAGGDQINLQKMLMGKTDVHNNPIGNTVFVANLDYSVTKSKLKEVFLLAGNVINLEMLNNKDGKPRGMCTITYEQSRQAAQAISMLNGQSLYGRPLVVKMDKDNNTREKSAFKLPAGLSGIGPSLDTTQGQPDFNLNNVGINNSMNSMPLNQHFNQPQSNQSNLAVFNNNPFVAAGLSAFSPNSVDQLQSNQSFDQHSNRNSNIGSFSAFAEFQRQLASMTQQPPQFSGNNDLNFNAQLILEKQAKLLAQAQARAKADLNAAMAAKGRDIGSLDNLHSSEISTSNSFLRRNHPKTSSIGNGSSNNISLGGGGNFNGKKGVTVFVRNIAYNINWNQLRERFHKLVGGVMYADIKVDESGKSRGFGYVRFEEKWQAMQAISMFNNMEWEGRRLRVELKPE